MKLWWPPIVFGVVMLGMWQLLTVVAGVPSFLLPSPSAIAEQFVANLGNIGSASLATGTNALIGLVAGAVLGLLGRILSGGGPGTRG